ncbi:hypothetical protein FB451DRAFT_1248956 [Mycena latifolia]|nr:hypothetical protein FB451DRAFT_1248956 [Mycena latifolia]
MDKEAKDRRELRQIIRWVEVQGERDAGIGERARAGQRRYIEKEGRDVSFGGWKVAPPYTRRQTSRGRAYASNPIAACSAVRRGTRRLLAVHTRGRHNATVARHVHTHRLVRRSSKPAEATRLPQARQVPSGKNESPPPLTPPPLAWKQHRNIHICAPQLLRAPQVGCGSRAHHSRLHSHRILQLSIVCCPHPFAQSPAAKATAGQEGTRNMSGLCPTREHPPRRRPGGERMREDAQASMILSPASRRRASDAAWRSTSPYPSPRRLASRMHTRHVMKDQRPSKLTSHHTPSRMNLRDLER